MPDKENSPVRPNRIGWDSTPELKARLLEQTEARGFGTNYKAYVNSLIERDRDILAGVLKISNKYLPKPINKSRSK